MRSNRVGKFVESSLELFDNEAFATAHRNSGSQASIEERGAIFTKVEVVEFILDLIEYTSDKDLYKCRILEPSVGNGDFLFPVLDRLLNSIRRDSVEELIDDLSNSIVAVEIHEKTVLQTRQKLIRRLLADERFNESLATSLAHRWIVHSDFLLFRCHAPFDYIVGNPPYVRQELIPENLLKEYKRKFATIYDRADLYIPFIEHSLNFLASGGQLGFICADRWMKNKYGGPLRDFISKRFHLKYYVDMTDIDAFHSDVIAYPAITVFSREKNSKTRVAHKPKLDELTALAKELLNKGGNETAIAEIEIETIDSAPWILDIDGDRALLRKLEHQFPLIEDTGCKVGIGVATGADSVFIDLYDELDVEPDRKLPIVMTKDIVSGQISWRGFGVVNPYNNDGSLIQLKDFPRLKNYFERHKELVAKRHVAKNNPQGWYKTIDKIDAPLRNTPKLLIPDIKGTANIVYDKGDYYPHHNLYYISSASWDLKILQAILLSGIATFFVSKYSPQMRGGYLRFQAQYLRRIRIPFEHAITSQMKIEIINAINAGNRDEVNNLIFDLYDLTKEDRTKIILK